MVILLVSSGDPSAPWWDAAWVSDVVVILSVLVAVAIYWRQRLGSTRRQRESTLAHLKGVKASMEAWADDYFGTGYEGDAAENRSEVDFNAVMQGGYSQNFCVPTEPVVSLIQPPGDAWPISSRTVEAASVALLRLTIFNQFVQQQTDFNLLHAAELKRPDLSDEAKMPIALASRRISKNIHASAIGDGSWYKDLIDALDANVQEIEGMLDFKSLPST